MMMMMMDRATVFKWIKRVAAILLAICFVLPLSRCSTKPDPQAHIVAKDSYVYGYEMALASWTDLRGKDPKGIYWLLAIFNVFFVPLAVLGLKAKAQSIIYFFGSLVSAFFLYLWVFVFATDAEIGGIIAIACWALLFITSCSTIFELWRSARLKNRGQVCHLDSQR
ncbi:hypothetical protein [Pseudoduganella violaceinigra]|uniref:hypothetical protein n=1 Tax=Pseudoduganella violaceinigra TaxID=246602 RepID=UPI000487C81C|nr:hypothetical protein [Pseudoduganella violaceinigra]